ncbi:MAG: hypothetical protein POELPBGB_00921 [Bacteroidia bacterium]|nr:hypothetical protein [Bacteroidia bacterium]
MDKLENLKKLKKLLDDNVITEKEYSEMKNEILGKSENEIPSSNFANNESKKETQQKKNGSLTLSFGGVWLLVDWKTYILVNNELHSTHSIKKGFTEIIPINAESMILTINIGAMSTTYELEELNQQKNYSMELSYSRVSSKFDDKFNFSENG